MPALLPTGTVTFLFTDIEGSTRLLQAVGPTYGTILEEHRRLIRSPADANGGVDFGSEGDALFLVFRSAAGAVATAIAAQRALASHPWPGGIALRVRMGVHTGEATLVGENYVGLDLHRVARISSAGHGGQVLLSDATFALVAGALPTGVTARDMGERRLKDLSRPEHLYQLVIEGLPAEFPALKTLDATPNNLPTQLTSFVGREREVAEARALMERSRLLTLTGPGGTGKTRLSLQIAAESADQFSGGAFFVPLESITDPALVASTIVTALNLPDTGQRPGDRLLDYLRDRQVLLVLDNFEQVLDAAPIVADILRASPRTTIVVTSRAPLRVSGEREFPVPPLAVPDARTITSPESLTQFESVALFIERAAAVRPDFQITTENAAIVVQICARLDGLPLAIELAAARVKLLTPEAILARLNQRLGLAGSGARDLPARQQTLRGAIAWSHDLLPGPERRLLARASVFVGGMQLDEAEAICGPSGELGVDVLDGLAALVDQSLLRQTAASGDPRFQMLQTIRDFSLERLAESGEAPGIEARHALGFLDLAERAEPFLTGSEQRTWLDRLEVEHDNLRAAIGLTVRTGNAAMALRFAGALWRFWQIRGYLDEAEGRIAEILAMPGSREDPALRRRGLDAAAGITYWHGNVVGAGPFYEESLALARQIGDPAGIAEALYNDSFVWMVTKEDVPKGMLLANEALALFRQIGDPVWIARTLWAVGNGEYFLEEFERAREILLEAVAAWRRIGDRFGLAWALHTSGLTRFKQGRIEEARTFWTEMLQIFAAAEDVAGVGTALSNFRSLAVEDGDVVRALRLGGASAAIVARGGVDLTSVISEIEGREDRERGMIEEAAAAKAWADGEAMGLAEAVAYALSASRTPGAEVLR